MFIQIVYEARENGGSVESMFVVRSSDGASHKVSSSEHMNIQVDPSPTCVNIQTCFNCCGPAQTIRYMG